MSFQGRSIYNLTADEIPEYLGGGQIFGISCEKVENQYSYELEVGEQTILDKNQPPFSIIIKNGIKMEKLRFCDFFDDGYHPSIFKNNRQKMDKLIELLRYAGAEDTVTSLMTSYCDSSNSDLMFEFIQRLKRLKSIKIPITAFTAIFGKSSDTRMESVESVTLNKIDRLKSSELDRLLQIFPNTKEIHFNTHTSCDIDSDVIRNHAHLIKTLTNLKESNLNDIQNLSELKIYRFNHDLAFSSPEVLKFVQNHPEIRSCSLSIRNNVVFDRSYEMIEDLKILVETMDVSNVLRWTPNLKRLNLIFDKIESHSHEVVELKHLEFVEISCSLMKCDECILSLVKSCQRAKAFKLKDFRNVLSLEQINTIAENLINLESLNVSYDDAYIHTTAYGYWDSDGDYESPSEDGLQLQKTLREYNILNQWPPMPTLTHLELSQTGIISEEGIHRLKSKCPLLHTITFDNGDGNMSSKDITKVIVDSFPGIRSLTLKDNHDEIDNLNEIFTDGKGRQLQDLDFVCEVRYNDILKTFRKLPQLEYLSCKCKNGSVDVEISRRIFYDVDVVKKYSLHKYVQSCEDDDDDYY